LNPVAVQLKLSSELLVGTSALAAFPFVKSVV
jgi:hypothetical protein